MEKSSREKTIVKTSVLGIIVNAVLVAFKATVGFITGSIAVILDAVNNLSDALSSVITIVGARIAGKAPDKKHPFGHGRVEYVTSVIIAVIVLYAGITAAVESVQKIFTPDETNHSIVSVIIIAVAVLVKLFFGAYVRKTGKKIDSGALVASGTDALFDALLSFATLVAAILNLSFGLVIDGYLGVLISIIILKAGVGILSDTVSSLIGKRADKEITDKLKERITSFDGVYGVYDMILHDYGPNKIIGSAHIEVSSEMTAKEIHKLSREIIFDIYEKFGIVLTIGVYASSDSTVISREIKEFLDRTVKDYPDVLQTHGFYVDEENKTVSFDLIITFGADAEKIKGEITEKIKDKVPEYSYFVVLDSDFSD